MSLFADFIPIMILIIVIAFIFELMDASLGIGFGTMVTPILLIIGYDTAIVVPSVLLTELFAGSVAMIFHALLRNVKLGQKKTFKRRRKRRRNSNAYKLPVTTVTATAAGSKQNNASSIEFDNFSDEDIIDDDEDEEEILVEDEEEIELEEGDEIEEIKISLKSIRDRLRNLTTDTKVILVLSAIGILSAVIAAVLNVVFDYNAGFNFSVKIYIGIMVFAMGVLVLVLRNKKIKFSMRRIIGIGALAGFNKGISGGGYRPVTVIGQMLSGRDGKNALASTTFSKTAVSFVGFLAYVITHVVQSVRGSIPITWEYLSIAPYLVIGAIVAAPIGAVITRSVQSMWIKISVGVGTIILGIFSLVRLILIELNIWQKIPSLVEKISQLL
jgi:uncharacterized membrane protein YfcA